jgi:hypothetical protein
MIIRPQLPNAAELRPVLWAYQSDCNHFSVAGSVDVN